jgi:hypothetical protein
MEPEKLSAYRQSAIAPVGKNHENLALLFFAVSAETKFQQGDWPKVRRPSHVWRGQLLIASAGTSSLL